MSETIPPAVAIYAGRIAKFLKSIECVTDHGHYYVSRVVIGYDGEDTNVGVVPNEFDGYDVTGSLGSGGFADA